MQLDVRRPDPTTTTPAASNTPTAASHETALRTRLDSLVTYIGALATLMTPEGVVALANGAPSLEADDLVRLINARRLAA